LKSLYGLIHIQGKGQPFFLAKGQISQMELLVMVTERLVLLRRVILEVGIWPKHKCQRSVATVHDLINDLGGKHLVD
jgi:hypothetical protein